MPTLTKEYLGDSVYVEVSHGMLKLTTNNGEANSNNAVAGKKAQ
jgi:hypothetical protein